jgi:hypothetical protein
VNYKVVGEAVTAVVCSIEILLGECDGIQNGRNCDEVRATFLLDYTIGVKDQRHRFVDSFQHSKEETLLEPRQLRGTVIAAGDACKGVFGGQGGIYHCSRAAA